MKVLLINPPYQTITSNFGVGHQIPLGLFMVGGPLIDAGHDVRLLDAECRRLSLVEILSEVRRWGPDVVMTGHAGSTPAHPVCVGMLRAVKAQEPGVVTVYGGVYPSYHAGRILAEEPAVDLIVRGEGEATTLDLVRALETGGLTSASDSRLSPVSPTVTGRKSFSPTPDRRSRTWTGGGSGGNWSGGGTTTGASGWGGRRSSSSPGGAPTAAPTAGSTGSGSSGVTATRRT